MTDKGAEFANTRLKAKLSKMGINYYTSQNVETKAAFAERAIRTIKSKLYKYMIHNNTHRYIDILPTVVSTYNKTKNRYGFKPVEVTAKIAKQILRELQPPENIVVKFKFQPGDLVRISNEKRVFDKGYYPLWTREIFAISKQIPKKIPLYKIKDFNGEEIVGTFYAEELQKVRIPLDKKYIVDKIIKTRKGKEGTEYFVSYLGYPPSMNGWIKKTDLFNL